jgi:hypothetical protein
VKPPRLDCSETRQSPGSLRGSRPSVRTLLRKPAFTWERDGEELLRRRKKSHYTRDPLPGVTPVGARLAELLRQKRWRGR